MTMTTIIMLLVAMIVYYFVPLDDEPHENNIETQSHHHPHHQEEEEQESSSFIQTCGATEFLTDVKPIEGFHVLCVQEMSDGRLFVQAFLNGQDHNTVEFHVEADVDATRRMKAWRQACEQHLAIPLPETTLARQYQQPWRMFTPDGNVLDQMHQVVDSNHHPVFVFEGGQFIWPGIHVGHQFVIKDIDDWGDVLVETVSMTPLVFKIEEFLSDHECELIINLSLPHLAASGVSLMDHDEGKSATEWRTSSTYFLSSTHDPALRKIDRRVEQLTKIPQSHQEHAQVLRYESSQKYDAHYDFFTPDHYQKSPDVLASIEHGYKNRMITVFWYMSDVAKGGHTAFPRAGGLPPPTDYTDCSKGFKVAPKKRMVIVFYSLLPNGKTDAYSLHGGCPVEEGVKFSVNKWIWNKARNDDHDI